MQAMFEKLEALNSDKVSYAEVKAFFTEVITMIVENERKLIDEILGDTGRTDDVRRALMDWSMATQKTSLAFMATLEEVDEAQVTVGSGVEFFTKLIEMLVHNERQILTGLLEHPSTNRHIRRAIRKWGRKTEVGVAAVMRRHFNDHQPASKTLH